MSLAYAIIDWAILSSILGLCSDIESLQGHIRIAKINNAFAIICIVQLSHVSTHGTVVFGVVLNFPKQLSWT